MRVLLRSFDTAVIGYFLLLNTWYLVLIVLAAFEVGANRRRAEHAGYGDVFANPLTPPVSIVVPAHDEAAGIVESVRALLALHYPAIEIIVIDDGSTDGTFELLHDEFDLVEIPMVLPMLVPVIKPVESTWVPRDGDPIVVLRKQAGGSKVDPVNAGINAASSDLVCIVDADAVLDDDALLKVVKPLIDDPMRVVATGGTVRAVNGSTVYRGRVIAPRMPRSWLPRIQVIEYLRAFLLGRMGWSRLRALLIISGAFGVFRRDVLIAVGGMAHGTIGEDTELVARIHRHMRESRTEYRLAFVSEPVCWTEVPSTFSDLGKQRRRWSRGMAETLWKHRRMVGNPRYGAIGMLAMPYFLVFEVLGPVIELAGILTLLPGLLIGAVEWQLGLLFVLVAVGYGLLLSVASITIEELSYARFPRWRDLAISVSAAVLENVGYRQLHTWWRLQGLVQMARRREASWGTLTRTGFIAAGGGPDAAAAAAAAAADGVVPLPS